MMIEIVDPRAPDDFDMFCNPWMKDGFLVATVGEKAVNYLYNRTFRLYELAYCAKITFVNVAWWDYYKDSVEDKERAKREYEAHTDDIAEKCKNKHLYVLSELDDIDAATQCRKLANGNSAEGLSVLITHKKISECEYFDEIKNAFNIVIYLPDEDEDAAEILKWIICDFTAPGWIGVDYDSACYILKRSKEALCRKISYANVQDMKDNFHNDLIQDYIPYNPKVEQINRLLGVWVPRDFDPIDFDEMYETIRKTAYGDITICSFHNENEDDKSWTIALLSGVANKEDE